VLSWDSHPSEFSPPRFQVRYLAKPHAGDSRSQCHVHLRASSRRGCIPRPGLRRWVLEPRIRRHAWSIEPAYHRRAATLLTRASRALKCASHQPRPRPFGRFLSGGASCPCPLSAAPRASLPLAAKSPEGARAAGPRRRWNRTVDQLPLLAAWGGRRAPRGARRDRPFPGRPLRCCLSTAP